MATDICLVNMPYVSVRWPSLGLGILHAILERDGFSVTTLYANILYADAVGLLSYHRLLFDRPEHVIPEWTFAHIAFPDRATSAIDFADLLRARKSRFAKIPQAPEILESARQTATTFIESLVDDIFSRNPGIVACTSSFCQHVPSLALLKRVSERAPHVITLMGGANCESVMGKATHEFFHWIDYVVSGEADELISPLCRNILDRGRNIERDALPTGVFAPIHRSAGYPSVPETGTDEIPRTVATSLDGQPAPNYDAYFQALQQCPSVGSRTVPGVLVEGSRSCWWSESGGCTFCGLNGYKTPYRVRRGDEVLAELDSLSRRYNIKRFEFADNVLSPEFFKTLIPQLIERGAPYELVFEVRAGLTSDQVSALRKAGITWVQAGIESLHTGALKLMNKGTECRQNIQLLKWMSQYGIRCIWNLLHNLPDEDDAWFEEMASLFPLLAHLEAPQVFTGIRYSRFSVYEARRGAYNIRLKPSEPYHLIYPLEDGQLDRLVYFFDDELNLNAQRNSLLKLALQHPGLNRAIRECKKWAMERTREQSPSLIMRKDRDDWTVLDTRPVAMARQTTLRGLAGEVYAACDEAVTEEKLAETFAQKGYASTEIEDVITELVERKLLLNVDGRFLALALRHPVIPLQPLCNFPGGGYRFDS